MISSQPTALVTTGPQRLARDLTAGLSEVDAPAAQAGDAQPARALRSGRRRANSGIGMGSSQGASGGGCRPS